MELDYVTERVLSVFFPKDISDELYIKKLEELLHMLQGKYGDNFKVRLSFLSDAVVPSIKFP